MPNIVNVKYQQTGKSLKNSFSEQKKQFFLLIKKNQISTMVAAYLPGLCSQAQIRQVFSFQGLHDL
ncbi:MAG: hypothetical protein H7A25_03190 [Leptospiraceae bacterium]|nr:hypothetical protein [Leptospiraceae bacterium]